MLGPAGPVRLGPEPIDGPEDPIDGPDGPVIIGPGPPIEDPDGPMDGPEGPMDGDGPDGPDDDGPDIRLGAGLPPACDSVSPGPDNEVPRGVLLPEAPPWLPVSSAFCTCK